MTGSYSYVDPTGALITVTYTAGVMGYTETRERQEGYLDISSRYSAANQLIGEVVQSRRRPLLGPSPV